MMHLLWALIALACFGLGVRFGQGHRPVIALRPPSQSLRHDGGRVACVLQSFNGGLYAYSARLTSRGEPPSLIRPAGALQDRYRWTKTTDAEGRWIYQQEHA